jgi:transposase InsO family protein
MPQAVEDAVVRIRQVLQRGSDPELKYAFVGAETIQWELKRMGHDPPPSIPAINRALRRREMIQPRTKRCQDEIKSFCPSPVADGPNRLHQLDIVTRRIEGWGGIFSFHLIDVARRLPLIRQYKSKGADVTKSFLVEGWQTIGLPELLQMDNEATFCGGYRAKRTISQIVRLCLYVGIEVIFIPFCRPKSNGVIESFNGDWDQAFWRRQHFRDLEHVQAESPTFERWYATRHHPESLEGKTPAEVFPEFVPQKLSQNFDAHQRKLPITQGKVHFIRLADGQGKVVLLNETWDVGSKLAGEYIWATVSTTRRTLTILYQPDAKTLPRKVQQYEYPFSEPVSRLDPAYRRNP